MRKTNFPAAALLFFLPAIALSQSTPKAVAPSSQPTPADVQTLIDAKEYQAAIKLSSKLLALRGPGAAGMSRFQVTLLKGDAQAGAKSMSAAIMTYKSAGLETQDPHEQALSRWTAELFHTAGSNIYIPKIGVGAVKRGPFDLMKDDQRKQGFGALLDDNLSLLEPKLKTAAVSPSLVQIWPVLQQVVDLARLDEIANGSDDKITAIASTLLDHSRNLLSNVLKEYWARLGDIDTQANATTTSQSQQAVGGSLVTQTITQKNGLSESNKSELKEMITTCQKIRDAAQNLMKFAKSDDGWPPILADASRVSGRAGDVLHSNYSTSVSQTNTDDYNNGYGTGIIGGVGIYQGGGAAHVGRPTSRPTRTKPTTRP